MSDPPQEDPMAPAPEWVNVPGLSAAPPGVPVPPPLPAAGAALAAGAVPALPPLPGVRAGQFPTSPARGYHHHHHGQQQQQAAQAAAVHAAHYHQAQQQHAAAAAGQTGGLDAVAAAAAQDSLETAATEHGGGDNDVGGTKTGPFISQLFICPQCNKGLKSQAGLTSHLQHCNPEKIRAEQARNPQERALKINTKRRELWEAKFRELEAYKEEHRHCKVPSNDPDHLSLGRWVSSIRREYKKRQEGKKNQLTDERVLRLVSLGFDFSIHGTNWDAKYEELLEYKAKHGDVDVPLKYKDNQPLAVWVHRQRMAHRKRIDEGKKSAMTDERIAALEKLGFDWTVRKPAKKGKQMQWEERIAQLQAYKDEHGHCRVPRLATDGENSLGNWVALMRHNYRLNIKTLTEERKKELEDMGFEWRLKGRDMTPEERAARKKERADIEMRRQINREVRKRKHAPVKTETKAKAKKAKPTKAADQGSKKAPAPAKKAKKTASTTTADKSKKIRTYFGHVPRPAEDGGPPPLPILPPEGWATSNRKERIEAARRAAEYYGRMAKAWEDIAQDEEEEDNQGLSDGREAEKKASSSERNVGGDDDYSASEGYAADESEAIIEAV